MVTFIQKGSSEGGRTCLAKVIKHPCSWHLYYHESSVLIAIRSLLIV